MLHKPIKRFEQSGTILDDRFFARTQAEQLSIMADIMSESGYVPRLDINPDWSLSFNGKSYDFRLSVYGVHVGRKKAKELEGIDWWKEIPKSSAKIK